MADLQRLLAQTDAAIAERRVEELKVLADGFARKLAVNGFSVKEGIDALKPYVGKNLRPATGSIGLTPTHTGDTHHDRQPHHRRSGRCL